MSGKRRKGTRLEEAANSQSVDELRARLEQLELQLHLLSDERDRAVDERDQAVEELRAVREKQISDDEMFIRLVESGIIGLGSFDAAGRMLYANTALLNLIGFTAEEIAATEVRWVDFVPPEGLPRAMAALEELWSQGSCTPFEMEYQRRDGVRFWALVAAALSGREKPGVAFILDITQLKAADQELRRNQERLDMVQQSINLGVWYCDIPVRRLELSETCRRHFGLSSEAEITIDGYYALLHPDDLPHNREAIRTAIANRTPYDSEFRTIQPDGQIRWIRAIGSAFFDDSGKALRFDGITVDVTEQKQVMERLSEADRRKDEFLAMLAHELRNPLASISSALHVLELRGSQEEQPVRLRAVINRQTQHLARLVNDLLEAARVTQGKITLSRKELDLREAVERAVDGSRHPMDARKQNLIVNLENRPLIVEADSSRIEQVLCNLLVNASKYTAEGGCISILATRDESQAVIRVQDTGVGIPAEMLSQIFDLFTQANASLDRSSGGLGIGLTLAKRLVEMHGGSIEARSQGPGLGSEFIVRLPLAAGEEPKAVISTGKPIARPVIPRRVLVVEDNLDAADSLRELLELWGHHVQVAHDGLAALHVVVQYHPEVVLCDIGLPGMDGYTVAERLRENGSPREPLLVALTGYGDASDIQRSLNAGFDHHLIKPVDTEQLEQLLGSGTGQANEL